MMSMSDLDVCHIRLDIFTHMIPSQLPLTKMDMSYFSYSETLNPRSGGPNNKYGCGHGRPGIGFVVSGTLFLS